MPNVLLLTAVWATVVAAINKAKAVVKIRIGSY
jgi:hypothetical protein